MAKLRVILSQKEYDALYEDARSGRVSALTLARLEQEASEKAENAERTNNMFTACLRRMQELGRGTEHETPSEFIADAELGRMVRHLRSNREDADCMIDNDKLMPVRPFRDDVEKWIARYRGQERIADTPEEALRAAGVGQPEISEADLTAIHTAGRRCTQPTTEPFCACEESYRSDTTGICVYCHKKRSEAVKS